MDILLQKNFYFVIALGISITGGVSVYFVMENVLIPTNITIPLSIIISTIIYALTMYYSQSSENQNYDDLDFKSKHSAENKGSDKKLSSKVRLTKSIIPFVCLYAVVIIICTFSNLDSSIYKNWSKMDAIGIVQLGASIMLAFFLPGFAILLSRTITRKLNSLLNVVIAYFFSILITGLSTYFLAVFFSAQETQIKSSLLVLNVVIIAILLASRLSQVRNKSGVTNVPHKIFNRKNILSQLQIIASTLKAKNYEILAFGSLFALLIISTYYLYGGITIGDQWFHQGRSMLILTGAFEKVATSGLDSDYYPFQSALIAGLASLSGVPLVNTYASIAFLNIVPLFSFYYFYSRWVPQKMQRANLLASCLFVICSGFGWIYLISMVSTTGAPISEHSAIETISGIRSYILMPSNFIIASHPDFSTALIFITLPAGLVLLGLIRQILQSKIIFMSILIPITVLGILCHEEFYLFIIVASIAPTLFRIKQGHYIYLAFIFAFSIVYVINIISPQNYYNYTEVFGVPLLILTTIFVPIMWVIYLVIQNLLNINDAKIGQQFEFTKKLTVRSTRMRYSLALIIVVPVALLYVLSFGIVASITPSDANDEALHGKVSWYQYPMKLGLAGLLGVAFVLSYLFKKFDKEIFIFGIIIVISLLTSPYYDEHRFSKYIMLGIIPLASLLFYRILEMRFRYKPVINGILIMILVTTGSLSTLLFVGFNSLAFQEQDYTNDLGRRNFPTQSEIKLMEALLNGTDISSPRYNVISTPDEYNFYKGTLLTKLASFAGYPTGKLVQGRFDLNVTTLDSLFRLLDYTNARFIVIPIESIKQQDTKLTQPVRFALDNFHHYYENEKYVVLDVPPLTSPSSFAKSSVGLVYTQNGNVAPVAPVINLSTLQYNTTTFNSNELSQAVSPNNTEIYNNESSIICGPGTSMGLTIWSKGLDGLTGSGTNYIGSALRIANSHNNSKWTDAGLRWNQDNKQYYASISKNGLELYEKTLVTKYSAGEKDKKLLYQNSEVQKKENVWYNLRIESLQNSINVYVDGILKAKYYRPDPYNGRSNISSVGISCSNSDVEFNPIKVGKVVSYDNESRDNAKDEYEHYYSLSVLALANKQYSTFIDADLSVLSNQVIILAADPTNWDKTTLNYYMNYVSQGGTLVVINSDSHLKGIFSELFSLQNNGTQKFNFSKIVGNNRESMNVSGTANNTSITHSGNVSIIASYDNEIGEHGNAEHDIVPFALEKKYDNGGKIILINAGPYFNAVLQSKQNFSTLSKVLDVLDLKLPAVASPSQVTASAIEPVVGTIDISGNFKLKSNSILQLNNSSQDSPGYSKSLLNNINSQGIKIYQNNTLKNAFSRSSIKDLKLIGDYDLTISSGKGTVPYMTSIYDYFGVSLPKFNMTINMSNKPPTSAEIVLQDRKNQNLDKINVNGSSTIEFLNIQANLPPDASVYKSRPSVPILLKSPEIEVDGKARFTALRFWWNFLDKTTFEESRLKAKLNFIDDYTRKFGNGTLTDYVTFMNNTVSR